MSSPALDQLDATAVLRALSLAKTGRIFSLDSSWWRAMPGHPVHPQFDVVTYRTPHGFRTQQDHAFLNPPANSVGYGFISELIIGTAHTGTHMDALCHVVCGDNDEWFGGGTAAQSLGDFGAMDQDASMLPPVVTRGVLLDVPAALGVRYLDAGYPITAADLERTAAAQGVEVQAGDAVLIRTGQMQFWPDMAAMAVAVDAGVCLDGARWLAKFRPSVVGADNVAFECVPSYIDGDPQPVHVEMIRNNGIPLIEWVFLEELAEARQYEFAFVCLPLTVKGATGSMVRPIAIA
jgi:kynurenine formamidase